MKDLLATIDLYDDDDTRVGLKRGSQQGRTTAGTFDKVYDQWILGNPHQEKAKKWSILENVIKPRFFEKEDLARDSIPD